MTGQGLDHYADPDVVRRYEAERFSGRLGRARWNAEQRALSRLFDLLPAASTILDCPVGNGRWAEELLRRGHDVIGVDRSRAMLAASRGRLRDGRDGAMPLPLSAVDARRLPFADGSVDVVFSHALTKHLPLAEQAQVFGEFVRVSRGMVLCSFSVLSGWRGVGWRLRRRPDAHGCSARWLEDLATGHGVVSVGSVPCSTAVGVERSVLFRRPRSRPG